uniref:Uncharacterized protein n=1 Tax=Kalanchoe fedtschenkoi TaxID=63787 RepID=A0A7N0TZQ1_KALFE
MSRTWFSPFVELLQPIRLIDLNGSTRLTPSLSSLYRNLLYLSLSHSLIDLAH